MTHSTDHGLNPSDANQFRWRIPSCCQWRCRCRPGQGPHLERAHLRFGKHPYCGTGICTAGIHRQQGSPGSMQLPLRWQSCLSEVELQLLMWHLYLRNKNKRTKNDALNPNVKITFTEMWNYNHFQLEELFCWRVIRLAGMQHGTKLGIHCA